MNSSSVTGRLFYVPTNRLCADSLSAYLEEAADLQRRAPQPVTFAVIENGPIASDEHARVLSNAARTHLIGTVHLTVQRAHDFANAVAAHANLPSAEKGRVAELLTQPPHAYSTGPNLAALLAASIGASTLHRRDSDTIHLLHDGRPIYPAELEARYAGQQLSTIQKQLAGMDAMQPPFGDEPVCYIASDYRGDPPVDILELAELSTDLALAYERLKHPSATTEALEKRWREYYGDRGQASYESDIIGIDAKGLTEAGVSCCHRLFLDLPEMPIRETLGCDYFQKNLLYRLEWPVLYHNRQVTHRYSSDRNTREHSNVFVRYNLSAARYLILRRIWLVHNRQLEERRADLLRVAPGRLIDADVYAQSLLDAQRAVTRDELIHIGEDLAAIYRGASRLAPERPKFARLADVLLQTAPQLVADVQRGVDDYIFLIRRWRRLISAAMQSATHVA